ncbi:thiol peroxidase [Robertkochia aurantiaca]|uniref:thiol peroxidase n=1 Tax=Robertkochia aurantiaca TaxID=2873700 RepID=UPI001CC965B9|nr:thiol peroxidase [Robertkochia sp. 3YJGBD-33]
MAKITLGGNPCSTLGTIPQPGDSVPQFSLTGTDLKDQKLEDYKGHRLIMNIFPSVNTGVCAASARNFNEKASGIENTKVLCISRDLPFAQDQFCAKEGLDHVVMLSDFRDHSFGKDYELEITDGPFAKLLSRVVIVTDETGKVIYSQQVDEIGDEPDYEKALEALK